MANKITLTFAGDADSLSKAAKQAEKATAGVGKAVDESGKQLRAAATQNSALVTGLGHLGSATTGATDALDSVGGGLAAVNDLQQAGANRAARLARATADAMSAQLDMNEALQDGKRAYLDINQAAIDFETAQLDAAEATVAYNKAVKEHGAGSIEAKRAALELKQANQDMASAQADAAEATNDAARAVSDAKTAQLDLNDAMREANPPELSKWAENLQLVTPLLSAVVGAIGLVTAAQWLWNAALWTSPITWIVVGVAAIVAGLILLWTQMDTLKEGWNTAWGAIEAAAKWAWDGITAGAKAVWSYLQNVWSYVTSLPDKLRSAFAKVTDFITAPFRAAFNFVSRAWNNTIGQLHWTVPGWVPGVGGNSISAPKLPTFHQGGIVPGALGEETLAVLQAGERVTPAGGGGYAEETIVRLEADPHEVAGWVLKAIREAVQLRGGDPVRVIRSNRG